MLPEHCKVGMHVYFGRENGEKTLGEVIKINRVKVKVKILEDRGNGRGSIPGSVWLVPFSMMEPKDAKEKTVERLPYSPFQNAADDHILLAILDCYCSLSPENLSCDGELPLGEVNRRRTVLLRKLDYLQKAFGKTVSEEEIYAWHDEREAYLRDQEEKRALLKAIV